MRFNIGKIYSEYDIDIEGASYIGDPKEHTVMYVSKKVGYLLERLENCKNCLVFAENGIEVKADLQKKHCIVFSDNPQLAYAKFAEIFLKEKQKQEIRRQYRLTEQGYYIGENVAIGADAYIEPGCVIGHDVIIGDKARILSGSVIKNATIGNNFLCNEKAVVGSMSFTITEDEYGNKYRIPTLGGVIIGNFVEIGAFDNICAGASGDTIIEDYAKLDALIHVGHEAHLCKNVELVAGTMIGGFTVIGEGAYTGINSCVKNRLSIGSQSVIGMGATVIKSVGEKITVAGNPAKILH